MLSQIESMDGVDIAYPDLRLSKITVQRGGLEKKAMAFGLPRETTILGFSQELLAAGEFSRSMMVTKL